ncbi:alpha/beta fold hydrolase [Cellulomonas fimi]|uniref:AB hydrolase-1 domain-containing protein n=1 Tax=Cellulomonas fimi (strain ATCC 484 / DSM 20113 / JCM 1341 / CCUG 24087 / LMG 16345 / NBRC 15513 / NCIMB 8980 / NCTC 7547 / NRS-133) TaxID=590998 RepID=F4H697_CELFA|nr:alpha/beta hydrolase [Cellulomonas fimi]AEE44409.1 hypothetical protein Celf_0264 [Cellulomonas fimi ATCC 484]NNH08300.1 alpha/beta hydrolase [Cellulomonas fimi]VEH26304.1 Alpha/beta hydrolase family [Cellulomonas fimi]
MTTRTQLVLVPGFWLGGWAWDDVVPALRAAGVEPHPVTLPGLDPDDRGTDPAAVTRADHVRAVTDVVDALDGDVVLVGHSGGGAVVGEAVDRRPDRVRRAVYVDSGPLEDGAVLALDLPADAPGIPLPSWEELAAAGSSLDGIDADGLARFRARAVPHPGGVARGAVHVSDPRRFDVPVTAVCTSLPSEVLRTMVDGGPPLHTELGRYDVTYVDLPTGHWPMFSRPGDLAAVLVDAARA